MLLLVGAARLLGAAARMIGQPAVVGELLAGILLGPSVFRQIAPDLYARVFESSDAVASAVFALAWLGVILLLVVIGFETDLGIIVSFRRVAVSVSAGSFLVPLAFMGVLAFVVPAALVGDAPRWVFAGFFALALSVSALPVVAKILKDLALLRRNFGQISLAAGMLMDAVGWLLLAALSSVAISGSPDLAALAASLVGLAVFLVLAATVGRWLLDRLFRWVLARRSSATAALTVTLLAALLGAAITQALRLEAILGAFVAGILLGVIRHQVPRTRVTLESLTTAFFAPVFFAYSGLQVDLTALGEASLLAWSVTIVALAMIAKLSGTYAGARGGGVDGRESRALAAGLSALGAMGIVVALVGLNLGVLSDSGYTVLVVAAIVTSILAPQLLRVAATGWPVPEEERARLERERLEQESVILGARRILLPTRGGANSVYAAQLITEAFSDTDVTVLAVDVIGGGRWRKLARLTQQAEAQPAVVMASLPGAQTELIRKVSDDAAATIVTESRLGYDLLVMGATEEESESLFSTVVDRVLAQVQVATITVRFPAGAVSDDPPDRILVPVTASRGTRAAEEFAYSLARRAAGKVLAFHVLNRPEDEGVLFMESQVTHTREIARELLAQATGLGSRMGVKVDTLVRHSATAEQEIVDLAATGDFDLLVVGTSTRALANRPFFGHGVSYIIDRAPIPVAVVSLPPLQPGAFAE